MEAKYLLPEIQNEFYHTFNCEYYQKLDQILKYKLDPNQIYRWSETLKFSNKYAQAYGTLEYKYVPCTPIEVYFNSFHYPNYEILKIFLSNNSNPELIEENIFAQRKNEIVISVNEKENEKEMEKVCASIFGNCNIKIFMKLDDHNEKNCIALINICKKIKKETSFFKNSILNHKIYQTFAL